MIAIIAANADKSVTLAEPVRSGQGLAWAMRRPQAAVDMRQSVAGLATVAADPAVGNRLPHNAVVTAIISSAVRRSDVQSQP
ncbi:hypothetical protein [Accumulibacter sp.]|uniref:hypothetical protein n=1 Tax=Accumulibacter sp. TaxID=2053492 RepID=UPI0028C4ECDD|nr:hypothetical protein [Accumulibacter sp.]